MVLSPSMNVRSGTAIALVACALLLLATVSVQAAPRRRLQEAPSWCEKRTISLPLFATVPYLSPLHGRVKGRKYTTRGPCAPVPLPSFTRITDGTLALPFSPPLSCLRLVFVGRRHPRRATPKERTPDAVGDEEETPYFKTDVAPSDDSETQRRVGGDSSLDAGDGDSTLLGPDMGREELDAEQRAESNKAKDCAIIFASFYATKPGGYDRKKGERCNGCHESPMFVTFDSARISNPGACTAVLTDTDTRVDTSKPGMDQVMIHRFKGMDRAKIGTGGLMVERMKVYNAFIKRARDQGWSARLIMVDTDIVILGSVDELFDQMPDFDYGLSVRASLPYPVQGGVQFVAPDRYNGAAAFSDYVLRKWLESMAASGKEGGFTGDQRAYQEAVAPVKDIVAMAQKGKTVTMEVTPPGGAEGTGGQLKVKLVPSDRFNVVPSGVSGTGAGVKKADIRILHYKGGRKEGMLVPYNAMKKGGIRAVHALKKLS